MENLGKTLNHIEKHFRFDLLEDLAAEHGDEKLSRALWDLVVSGRVLAQREYLEFLSVLPPPNVNAAVTFFLGLANARWLADSPYSWHYDLEMIWRRCPDREQILGRFESRIDEKQHKTAMRAALQFVHWRMTAEPQNVALVPIAMDYLQKGGETSYAGVGQEFYTFKELFEGVERIAEWPQALQSAWDSLPEDCVVTAPIAVELFNKMPTVNALLRYGQLDHRLRKQVQLVDRDDLNEALQSFMHTLIKHLRATEAACFDAKDRSWVVTDRVDVLQSVSQQLDAIQLSNADLRYVTGELIVRMANRNVQRLLAKKLEPTILEELILEALRRHPQSINGAELCWTPAVKATVEAVVAGDVYLQAEAQRLIERMEYDTASTGSSRQRTTQIIPQMPKEIHVLEPSADSLEDLLIALENAADWQTVESELDQTLNSSWFPPTKIKDLPFSVKPSQANAELFVFEIRPRGDLLGWLVVDVPPDSDCTLVMYDTKGQEVGTTDTYPDWLMSGVQQEP